MLRYQQARVGSTQIPTNQKTPPPLVKAGNYPPYPWTETTVDAHGRPAHRMQRP